MMNHADILAAEVSRYADQIRSLSRAASCMLDGSSLADPRQAQCVALELLDLIEFLADKTGIDANALEKIYRR